MTHSFRMRLFPATQANQCQGCARRLGPGETRLIGWEQRRITRGERGEERGEERPHPQTLAACQPQTRTHTPSLSPSLPPLAPVKTQRPPGALKCLHTLEIESNGINQDTFSPLFSLALFLTPPPSPPLSLISFPLFFTSSICRLHTLRSDTL